MAFALTKLLTLPANVLTGVGYLFKNNTHVAISRGGLTFDPQIEMRNIPYDGQLSPTAELDRVTFSGGTFGGTFIAQFGESAIFEPGSVTSAPGGNVATLITPQPAGELFVEGDYLTNLRLYFPETGWQIRMLSAICESYSLATEDRGEGLFTATFAARLPLDTAAGSAPGTRPYIVEKLTAFS